MSTKKINLDEWLRNHLAEPIEELKNYEFGTRIFLPASVIESSAICKIYAESEYLNFKNKCKDFGIFNDDLKNYISKYLALFKKVKNQKNSLDLHELYKKTWEIKYQYNTSRLNELTTDKYLTLL